MNENGEINVSPDIHLNDADKKVLDFAKTIKYPKLYKYKYNDINTLKFDDSDNVVLSGSSIFMLRRGKK